MSHLRAVPSGPTGPSCDSSSASPRSGSASSVRVEAPGKVNLFLSVGAPGPDGYHPLTTVFQAVRLIETVTARRQSAQDHGTVTLTLEEPDADVPTDASNLAVQAAMLLAEATGVGEGVDLLLRKRVPVAGGMAGGSADAAAALVACNQLWDLGLGADQLQAIGRSLGADVPACLVGGIALGTGRGDRMRVLADGEAGDTSAHHWVMLLAHEGLSTPEVFREFDRVDAARAPGLVEPTPGETRALRSGPEELSQRLVNDLQAPALRLRPELARTMEAARRAGALAVTLSGSGPTVAALARDAEHAHDLARALEAEDTVARAMCASGPAHGAVVEETEVS